MRFTILPLLIHRESQFGPAGNDVLIEVAPLECALSGQMTLLTPFYKPLSPYLALSLEAVRSNTLQFRRAATIRGTHLHACVGRRVRWAWPK